MEPTRDHEEIRRWAATYNAVPAEVRQFKHDGEPSRLRFLFGHATTGTPELRPISWEDFFARFDLMELEIALYDAPEFEIITQKDTELRLSN